MQKLNEVKRMRNLRLTIVKLPKAVLPWIIGFAIAIPCAQADKFDISLGYFDLTAQQTGSTGSKSGNASSLGLYQFLYRHQFTESIEVGLGYSVMASSGIGGDLGYGVDLGIYYFPFTPAEAETIRVENSIAVLTPVWRPYVTAGFYQRQFQAVQTGYAGAGAGVGVERALSGSFALRAEARYIKLSGTTTSTANTTDLMFGVSFGI
jgi:opacity protein-like surface antigen